MQKQILIPKKNYRRQTQSYVFFTIMFFVAAAIYGYFDYTELTRAKAALNEGQVLLMQMQSGEKQIANDYLLVEETYKERYRKEREAIKSVFPMEEDYTSLTKVIDAFMYETNTTSNPIFMSDLKFSKARIDANTDYAVLPFSLTLSTTRQNFEAFLKYIESSGSLDNGSRLMDIKSISINFPTKTERSSGYGSTLMNVSISLNAYFQKISTLNTK
jgi:hypothetical protein